MNVDIARTCVLIERSAPYHGKQGLDYFAGVAAETAGPRGLCLHTVTIPPLGRAKPHLHENHESANPSGSEPCVGLTARTDPNEQESVTLLELADPGIAKR
jgi:uncharacterized RmlC-like cupin family protein